MSERVPQLLPIVSAQAATKQAPESALQQANAATKSEAVPFTQALAEQLTGLLQANPAGKHAGAGADTAVTGSRTFLPPDGGAVPLSLPLTGVQLASDVVAVPGQSGLAATEADTQADVLAGILAASAAAVVEDTPAVALSPVVANLLPTQPPPTAHAVNPAVQIPEDVAQDTFLARRPVSQPAAVPTAAPVVRPEPTVIAAATPVPEAVVVTRAQLMQQMTQDAGRMTPVSQPGDVDAITLQTPAPATVTHDPRAPRVEAPVVMHLSVPLQDSGWGTAVSQRVLWMLKQETQSAELRINPPGLGAVEVRVLMGDKDQARVSFTSPHADVREALEAALPRLREMLTASGLSLTEANVSAHSFAEQRQASQQQERAQPGAAEAGAEQPGSDEAAADTVKISTGLLDLYA